MGVDERYCTMYHSICNVFTLTSLSVDRGDIIILQEYHLIGVLYHCTGGRTGRGRGGGDGRGRGEGRGRGGGGERREDRKREGWGGREGEKDGRGRGEGTGRGGGGERRQDGVNLSNEGTCFRTANTP